MMEIIPAMDLIGGECVRLKQGDYGQKTSYGTPLEIAQRFEQQGFTRLHMVDLDGAKAGTCQHLAILERITSQTNLIIDFSGGIQTEVDLKNVFNAGASIAAIGSLAVRNTALFLSWLNSYGADKILLGADVRAEKLAIKGWTEQTDFDIFDFLEKLVAHGLRQAFVTDIALDGMMLGPSFELYAKIKTQLPDLELIASGGVRTHLDIDALEKIGCSGAIVGKALLEGTF